MEQSKVVAAPPIFMGTDPGIHAFVFVAVDLNGNLIYICILDLAPKRNAKKCDTNTLLNSLRTAIYSDSNALLLQNLQKAAATGSIGIEYQIQLKLQSLASCLWGMFGNTQFVHKSKYFKEATRQGSYEENKNTAVQLLGEHIRKVTKYKAPIRLHDICEAYKLANYQRLQYLSRKLKIRQHIHYRPKNNVSTRTQQCNERPDMEPGQKIIQTQRTTDVPSRSEKRGGTLY